MSPAAGWYADPLQRAELRWYDGATWTEHVRTGPVVGVDPIAAPAPVAATSPTPPVVPVPRSGMGRGAKAAIWLVSVSFVVLAGVAAASLVVLARHTPRLTSTQIEEEVGAAMSAQYGRPVIVSCPSATYVGGWDGDLECTAAGIGGGVVRVEVTVRNVKVTAWTVLGDAAPSG